MQMYQALVFSLGVAQASAVQATYKIKYYDQTLNHINGFSASDPTWSHRYLINDDYWGTQKLSDDCPGPILMYTGNEADVTGKYDLFCL